MTWDAADPRMLSSFRRRAVVRDSRETGGGGGAVPDSARHSGSGWLGGFAGRRRGA